MANVKNITELPVAESSEGLNLIVNDGGYAKQIAASAVGAQADWSVTDETSPAFILNKPEVAQADWNVSDESNPAFIKNKPVEEFDLDYTATLVSIDADGNRTWDWTVNHVNSYETILAKLEAGIKPKGRVIVNTLSYSTESDTPYHVLQPGTEGYWSYEQEYGGIGWYTYAWYWYPNAWINSDNTIDFWTNAD